MISIWDTENCLKFAKLVLYTAAKPLCLEEKRNYFNVNRTNGTASFNGIADQSIEFPTKRILLSTLNKWIDTDKNSHSKSQIQAETFKIVWRIRTIYNIHTFLLTLYKKTENLANDFIQIFSFQFYTAQITILQKVSLIFYLKPEWIKAL